MKRNKWQRLAAIGLCSSLLVNAFSGVTAVAETVTIESSPTAESSTKEETPASSVKEETTKASTENSQVTTDTSQEEETKEIEKQAEKVINDQLLPDVELPNLSNKASVISPRAGQDSTIYPRIQMEFVDELGAPFTEKLSLNGKYTEYARRRDNGSFQRTTVSAPIISSQATTNKYNVFTQAGVTVTANIGEGNYPTSAYYLRGYFLDTLSIANTLNYVDKIEFIPKTMYTAKYDAGKVALGPPIEVTAVGASAVDMQFKKNAQNLFSITSILGTTNTNMSNILAVNTIGATYDTQVRLVGFDGTAAYKETLSYKITRKQVTEKFVNTSGVAITPPTGFTQNKKTPMTSNAFTFKQAGTLPDTYTAGGKTYKFKGWYKGKTKTEPLKTTKAPSYGVTYDDNDDLNVVYEEEIPTASVTLTRPKEVIDTNTNVIWTTT
ncbi:MAG: WxL domain-containing protein, partial [Enterococcus faecalis]